MNLEDYTLGNLVSIEDLKKWKDLIYIYKFCEEKDDNSFDAIAETVSLRKQMFAQDIGRIILDSLIKELK